MGQSAYLAPEQLVVLHPRPEVARSVARRHLTFYLSLPAYRRNFLRLGFEQSDLLAGGSDRLIDTVVAHGSPEAVRQHAQAHLDAGADHVCLQVLDEDPTIIPLRQWKTLAAVLLEEGGSSSSLI
jgi:probable F420-dependent oxidoreductase